jgi:hypothetical protein
MINMFFVMPNKVNKEFSISKLYLLNKMERILDFEWLYLYNCNKMSLN